MKTMVPLAILAAVVAILCPSAVAAADRALVTNPTDPVQVTQLKKTIADLERQLAERETRKPPEPLVSVAGAPAAASGLPTASPPTPPRDWPSFLKVGGSYVFYFAVEKQPSTEGKIIEFGPGNWIRVSQEVRKKDGPVRLKEIWVNFPLIGSVLPREQVPARSRGASSAQGPLPFIKVAVPFSCFSHMNVQPANIHKAMSHRHHSMGGKGRVGGGFSAMARGN